MQIQIISTYDEMQSAFSEMFAEAVKLLPAKETAAAPYIVSGDELKTQLGVTIQTVIRWRKKGKIPFLQLGSSIRYDLNEVVKALEVNSKRKGLKNA
ncbi:helix-turn-helix domain-containing protein [Pedobacter sp. Du54]|uniref:helix-turn-helix domain-containing protein n=1 Tax=Pedobacter anseongensis TaxID=3133439 RepID=UPI0030A2DB59